MQTSLRSSQALRATAPLLLTLVLAGCAPVTPGVQTSETAAPAPQPAETTAEAPVEAELRPPDGKWLVDEEGRQYFTTELPRREGAYAWEGEGNKRIRAPYGLTFDVVSYDEQRFIVKIYRPTERVPKPPRPEIPTEAIEAAYRFDGATADRLGFTPFDAGLPREGQWRHGFELVDIDGDGQRDLVHGPARKSGSRPAIFLGDGHGNWRRWAEARFPALPLDYGDAAAGDLDGDGHLDLVIASHLRGIVALRGDGKGGFTEWSRGIGFAVGPVAGAAPPFTSREVELADWNRDGRLDILALGEGLGLAMAPGTQQASFGGSSSGVAIYLNQGDGSWRAVPVASTASTVFGDDLVVADFDGDGLVDLATGSGVQGAKGLLDLALPDGSYRQQSIALRDKATVRGLAAADFDGDGRRDLAVGYQSIEGEVWRTGVDVLLAVGEGGGERRVVFNEKSMDGIYGLAAGDLDGDGATDLVALTGDGEGWVFLGDGRGGFVRETGVEIAQPGCSGYHVELADLDGDGADEVVAGFSGEGGDFMGRESCPSGGSLRAWKPVPKARAGD